MFGSMTNFESLFDELRRIEQDMDQLFAWTPPVGIRSVSRGSFPATNVGATAGVVDVYLFAPGLDPNTIDLSIQQNLLHVSGERQLPINEKATYYRRERFGGEFRRVVTLPEDVDPDRVEANYGNGVLQVSVQRREAAKPRQIAVH